MLHYGRDPNVWIQPWSAYRSQFPFSSPTKVLIGVCPFTCTVLHAWRSDALHSSPFKKAMRLSIMARLARACTASADGEVLHRLLWEPSDADEADSGNIQVAVSGRANSALKYFVDVLAWLVRLRHS